MAKYSLFDYLDNIGLNYKPSGNKRIYYSLFNDERTPSMMVDPNGRFYDFSSGEYGDAIDLVTKTNNISYKEAVRMLDGKGVSPARIEYTSPKKTRRRFQSSLYTNNVELEERRIIYSYASSRKIHCWFLPSVFTYKGRRIPAMGFPHVDENGDIVGLKMRSCIEDSPRWRFQGNQGYYIIENITDNEPELWISESETSSNSLASYLLSGNTSFVVISFGSVSSLLSIPSKYEYITNRKVVIDYDGSEELYKKRIEKYKKLNCKEVKLVLPKGDDINTLYVNNLLDL